jgi:hypothetical protein
MRICFGVANLILFLSFSSMNRSTTVSTACQDVLLIIFLLTNTKYAPYKY